MRTPNLRRVSTDKLQVELRRRGRGLRKLQMKRDTLLRRVALLEAEIRSIGGDIVVAARGRGRRAGVGRRGGRRPRNAMNLVDALSKVLSGRTMSVTDVSDAVQQAGYKTTSKTFRTIVNQTLINSGRFRRVSRGQYTSK